MPFSNQDYLYQHLPARVRRDDEDLFLKRCLQFFGTTLDEWDLVYETFYQKIAPETAPEDFINWWLWALFGWSWYPRWFAGYEQFYQLPFVLGTEGGEELGGEDGSVLGGGGALTPKRRLYRDFAEHLARRGTARGIEGFLQAFSVLARVYNGPQYWGEFVWGEGGWTITDALGIVVQVQRVHDEVNHDVSGMAWGEFVFGEGYFRDMEATLTRKEIEDLLRFEWPNGQRLMVQYQMRRNVAGVEAWESDQPILNEDYVPDENSGPVIGGVN